MSGRPARRCADAWCYLMPRHVVGVVPQQRARIHELLARRRRRGDHRVRPAEAREITDVLRHVEVLDRVDGAGDAEAQPVKTNVEERHLGEAVEERLVSGGRRDGVRQHEQHWHLEQREEDKEGGLRVGVVQLRSVRVLLQPIEPRDEFW